MEINAGEIGTRLQQAQTQLDEIAVESHERAAAATDETNLSKASIRSPIDGVVLTRSVDPGNAVAASLQAVTLFTIAEDLSKLRLQVNVDEADVGSVKVGQKASFTVSAYPSRKYPATITRVAYGSTTTDNVVTYVTYLEVDNKDLSLRPGMTAASTISAPVARLVQAAGRVAGGDLSARVDADADPDEIAVLSRAFNSMTHDLQAQQDLAIGAHERGSGHGQHGRQHH